MGSDTISFMGNNYCPVKFVYRTVINTNHPCNNIKVSKEIDEALAKFSANRVKAALTKEVQFPKDAVHDLGNYGKYHINMPVLGLRPKVWMLTMVAFTVISVVSLHFNRCQYFTAPDLKKSNGSTENTALLCQMNI